MPDDQNAPSERGGGRREQLVVTAIETIAELGYEGASLARIAERAGGISKGVIDYHFAGKDELVDKVVDRVLASAGEELRRRTSAPPYRPAATLSAWVEGTLALASTHRSEVVALLEIRRVSKGRRRKRIEDSALAGTTPLRAMLSYYQQQRQLPAQLDTAVAALAIRGALDAAVSVLATDRRADPSAQAGQLADLLVHGVRAHESSASARSSRGVTKRAGGPLPSSGGPPGSPEPRRGRLPGPPWKAR